MNTPKLIATFLAVFAITSYAATAEQLKTTIEGLSSGTGSLAAAVDGNTVTVTGTKTGVTSALSLNIDNGVSVIWEANFSGTSSPVINLSGEGPLIVITGGQVRNTYSGGGTPPAALSNNGTLIILGGTVTPLLGGAAIRWDNTSVTTYTAFTSDNLIPANTWNAVWLNKDGKAGIDYANASGTITGFAEVSGVTVNKVQIAKPEVANTSLVYTGSEQSAGIAENNEAYTITGDKEARNAGNYTATASLVLDKDNSEWSDGTDDDLSLLWAIAKAKIAKPSVTNTNLVYTGSKQSAGIAANAAYTVTGDKGTDVNSYTATIALNDKANHEWTDGTTADLTLPWAIATQPAPPAPPIDPILPQIAAGNIRVQPTANAITLENLPKNTKVQVYTLQGKQIHSANSGNNHPADVRQRESSGEASQILKIQVQTKGIYVVKINNQTLRVVVR